jgi:hypothetical protein
MRGEENIVLNIVLAKLEGFNVDYRTVPFLMWFNLGLIDHRKNLFLLLAKCSVFEQTI